MDSEFYRKRRPEIPATRNVWLRVFKMFLYCFVISYALYWIMSQLQIDDLLELDNKRSDLFLAMFSIMPATGWGWLLFLTSMILALWGEWRDYHFQSYPKEKSLEEEK